MIIFYVARLIKFLIPTSHLLPYSIWKENKGQRKKDLWLTIWVIFEVGILLLGFWFFLIGNIILLFLWLIMLICNDN